MSLSESVKFMDQKRSLATVCGTHAVPKNRMCEAEDFPIKAVKNSYNRNSGKTKIIFFATFFDFLPSQFFKYC